MRALSRWSACSKPWEADGKASTLLGTGLTYDLDEHYHLLTYWGPGLGNVTSEELIAWQQAIVHPGMNGLHATRLRPPNIGAPKRK